MDEFTEFIAVSISWNLIWLSAWILESLFDNLSNLKLISSNLFVNTLNWSSTSDNLSRCLVNTSSEFWSSSKLETLLLVGWISIDPE